MTGPSGEQGKGSGPMRYAGLGIQLAISILVLVWAGQWLDRRLKTGGLFAILGALLGFAGTMWPVIRSLRKDEQSRK